MDYHLRGLFRPLLTPPLAELTPLSPSSQKGSDGLLTGPFHKLLLIKGTNK